MAHRQRQYSEEELNAHLRDWWGYECLRPEQVAIIQAALSGQDIMALMPTGGGKSICFQLPAMLLDFTIVISPLKALMKDQFDDLPAYVREQTTFINSDLHDEERARRITDIGDGRYKLVYVAPERMSMWAFLEAVIKRRPALLVVDEAHCISTWGYDFRPDYFFIRKLLPLLGQPQLLALTATATDVVARDINQRLGRAADNPLTLIRTSTYRSNLRFEVAQHLDYREKLTSLIERCKNTPGSIIVYTRYKDESKGSGRGNCEELARALTQSGSAARYYHADMDEAEKTEVHHAFRSGEARVVVATIAFGMGVNNLSVRAVINFTLPDSLEDYVQQAGRAGRDNREATCTLLCTKSDVETVKVFSSRRRVNENVVQKVYEMLCRFAGADAGAERRWSSKPLPAGRLTALYRKLPEEIRWSVKEGQFIEACGLLEQAGYIYTGIVPFSLLLQRLTPEAAATASEELSEFNRFCQKLGLKTDGQLQIDVIQLANRYNRPPDNLDAYLLGCRVKGWLRYDDDRRGQVITVEGGRQPNQDERIIKLIKERAVLLERQADSIIGYVNDNRKCRHQLIAAYFAETNLGSCETTCDNCVQRLQAEQARRIAATAKPRQRDTRSVKDKGDSKRIWSWLTTRRR